jgi:hypothetical protein
MAKAEAIVGKFMKCLETGDFQTLRGLLKDDLSFKGPFDSFDEPCSYLAALQKLHPVIARLDVKKCSSTATTCASSTTWSQIRLWEPPLSWNGTS